MSAEKKFDFHSHSIVSDGTYTPTELVEEAARQGVKLLALTDHDNIGGVSEAVDTGRRIGLPVLPAVSCIFSSALRGWSA